MDQAKYRFLKCISLTIEGKRKDWLKKQSKIQENELELHQEIDIQIDFEQQMMNSFSDHIYELFDSEKMINYLSIHLDHELVQRISNLSEIEQSILFQKAIGEFTFQELSDKLDLPINKIVHVYYKTISELKKEGIK